MSRLSQRGEAWRRELRAGGAIRWASILFTLAVLTLLISLAASQTFLGLAGLLYAFHLVRHPAKPRFPPVKLPLALFCLLTVVSIHWSENHAVGWLAVRKLVLFLILLLCVNLVVSVRHLEFLYRGLFVEAAVAGVVAAVQFVEQYRSIEAEHPGQLYFYLTLTRITGFMGHWMNFGGQQMLMFAGLLAFVLLSPRISKRSAGSAALKTSSAFGSRIFWWIMLAIVAASIVLNFTRGVWLGCSVAALYAVARWKARWLAALPVLALLAYAVSPSLIRERIHAALHPTADAALSIRFEMWGVGRRMIERHPWVGVGPNNIPEAYTLYLPPGRAPEVGYHDHLHDNFIQLAAERGLPALTAWLWFMLALAAGTIGVRRRLVSAGRSPWVADAALAAWLAFFVEGFFEYNFGTSPVLMVFLFVTSTPFVPVGAAGTPSTAAD